MATGDPWLYPLAPQFAPVSLSDVLLEQYRRLNGISEPAPAPYSPDDLAAWLAEYQHVGAMRYDVRKDCVRLPRLYSDSSPTLGAARWMP